MSEAQERVEALEIAEEILVSHGHWPLESITLRLHGELALARALLRAEERLREAEARWQEMEHPFDASEFKALRARLQACEEALRGMMPLGEPLDDDQNCLYCGAHYHEHEQDCAWVRARAALDTSDSATKSDETWVGDEEVGWEGHTYPAPQPLDTDEKP